MKRIAIIFLAIACIAGLTACAAKQTESGYITVTFDSGTGVEFSIKTNGNQVVRMPEVPDRPGYRFDGWFYEREGVRTEFKSDTLTYYPITESIKVAAQWTSISTEVTDGNFYGAAANTKIASFVEGLEAFDNCRIDIQKADGVFGKEYTVRYDRRGNGFTLVFDYADYSEYYTPSEVEGVYNRIMVTSHGGYYETVYKEAAELLLQELLPQQYLAGKSDAYTQKTATNKVTVKAYYGGDFAADYKNSVSINGDSAALKLVYPALDTNKQLVFNEITADGEAGYIESLEVSCSYDARFSAGSDKNISREVRRYTYGGASISIPSVSGMTYMGADEDEVIRISFDSGYGEADYEEELFAAQGDTVVLPAPVLAGREFDGWYDESCLHRFGGAGDELTVGGRDLKLYAVWEEVLPIFFLGGGYFDMPIRDCITFSGLSNLPAPLKTGYGFGGWYKDAGFTVAAASDNSVYTADDTVYARWIPLLKVDVVCGNGMFLPSVYGEQGEDFFDALIAPQLEGHTFDGWYADSLLVNPVSDFTFSPTLTTVFAKYRAGFVLTFGIDGTEYGVTIKSGWNMPDALDYLEEYIAKILYREAKGCELRGLFLDEELTVPFDMFPEEDITIYPDIKPKKHLRVDEGDGKVKYEYLSDMLAAEQESLYSRFSGGVGDIEAYLTSVFGLYIEPPVGKTISGWYLDSGYTTRVADISDFDEDITLYIQYS